MTPPSKPSDLDLSILWEALQQQRWPATIFLGAVLVTAFLATKLTTPIYEAVALIQLMPRAGQEVDVNAVVSFDEAGYLERRDRARTQIQVILSRSVREAVISAYNEAGFEDLTGADGIGELKGMMTVGPREDTQLVEIKVEHTDPERAAKLANLITEVYTVQNLTSRTSAARETRVWLEGQTGDYRTDLDAATQAVMAFKEANDLVGIDEKVDDVTRRMSSLQSALAEKSTELALLDNTLSEHRRMLWNGKHAVLAGAFDTPALKALSEQHALVLTETAEVFARYGEKHPKHKEATDRVARIEALIAQEVGRLVDGEKVEYRILEGQVERLNTELDLIKAELLDKQRLKDQYRKLKMEEDRLRKMYGSLSERGAEVELQARTRLSDVRIVDAALPPSRPARPSLPLNMAVALLVGLGGGVGLALIRHRMDDTLRTVAALEESLDAPLLGALPQLPASLSEEERALYAHAHPQSATAETLRSIRALLHAQVGSSNPKRLVVMTHRRFLVTSTQPGEGKTDTALGLAVSFAKLGIATLLVDADLRRPRLHALLGVERGPGLSDVLKGDEAALDLVCDTSVSNLYLLPCGEPVDAPNELLASSSIQGTLARLGGRYPVVIIDTPPVSPVSDALVMAPGADVLMLVRHGKVSEPNAVRTLERLRQAGASVQGIIFNGVPTSEVAYRDRYYGEDVSAGEPAAR